MKLQDDNLKFWIMFFFLLFSTIIIIVLSVTMYEIQRGRRVVELVKNGEDPVVASCSLNIPTGALGVALCTQVARKKASDG